MILLPKLILGINLSLSAQFGILKLPFQGVINLLGWAQLVPFAPGLSQFLSDQRSTLKSVSSTFAVPSLLLKPIKLAEEGGRLIEHLNDKKGISLDKVLHDVKKIFFTTISFISKNIKVALLFKKTNVIQLSTALATGLEQGETFLSLGLNTMKMVDAVWQLSNHLKKTQISHLNSQKTLKLCTRLTSKTLKVASQTLSALALFLGFTVAPPLLLFLSTLSFSATLVKRVIWYKDSLPQSRSQILLSP